MADMINLTREKFTNIANAIRNVNGEIREYTVDEMPIAIEGLSAKDGFVAKFYDENNNLIQTVIAKESEEIYAPEYNCSCWIDSDNALVAFPTTITEDVNFYAMSNIITYADLIYKTANLDKNEYPYLCVYFQKSKFGTDARECYINIAKRKSGYYYYENICYLKENLNDDYPSDFSDLVDISARICSVIMDTEAYTKDEQYHDYSWTDNGSFIRWSYVNHDVTKTNNIKGRLDTLIENTVENLYKLQDKTVTENGEVTPDEGYYGLSKVNVIVDMQIEEPTLQEKTVTVNGEVVADDGYDGLSKVTVMVPEFSGGDIENAYMVNFYDNDELIETTNAKFGILVKEPLLHKLGAWDNTDGEEVSFPITYDANTVENLYFRNYAFLNSFYEYFGVDSDEYPGLYINSWYSSNTNWRIKSMFFKGMNANPYYLYGCKMCNNSSGYYNVDITPDEYENTDYYRDAELIFEKLKEGNVSYNYDSASYSPDNDTVKSCYFTTYSTDEHTNWIDLRTVQETV